MDFNSLVIKIRDMKTTARSLPALLQLMIDNKPLFEECCNRLGLCAFTHVLTLYNVTSYEEEKILDEYIEENRPRKTKDSYYAWPEGEWNPRQKWLKKQIKKLTPAKV
jgi:hypothetical protein